jgi:hypothetical protein
MSFKVIFLTLVIFITAPLTGAQQPQQPQRLPTFLETVKQEEERQAKELKERQERIAKRREEVKQWKGDLLERDRRSLGERLVTSAHQEQVKTRQDSLASLQALPTDLQAYIFSFFVKSGQQLDIEELAKTILTLAGTSKALYAAINNPANMIAIFNALPYQANAIDLAEILRGRPVSLPVMHSWAISRLVTRVTLVKGKELYEAVRRDDIKTVEQLLALRNIDLNWSDRHGCTSIEQINYASTSTGEKIREMLRKAGARPNKNRKYVADDCTIL